MVSKIKKKILSFQDTIFNLQKYWSKKGCAILQPYDLEVGAGTFHPATTLRSLGPKPWKTAYVQPSRRPTDGRYGDNPNRLQHYYQFQVLIKPSPKEIKKMYLNSLSSIGINHEEHDIRLLKMTGKVLHWERQVLDGKFGVMEWKLHNLPISNKWLELNVNLYLLKLHMD